MRNLAAGVRARTDRRPDRHQGKRMGMDQPFIVRSFNFLTMQSRSTWAARYNMTSNTGSNSVRLIILERLPPTLVLFATADIFLFFPGAVLCA